MSNKEISKLPLMNQFTENILRFFPNSTIYLFGSRSRNDYEEYSDYDLLIISEKSYSKKTRIIQKLGIQQYLQNVTNVKIHILLESHFQTNFKSRIKGNIVRWAINEGIILYKPDGGIGYTPPT